MLSGFEETFNQHNIFFNQITYHDFTYEQIQLLILIMYHDMLKLKLININTLEWLFMVHVK